MPQPPTYALLGVLAVLGIMPAPPLPPCPAPSPPSSLPAAPLHVQGNRLVTDNGTAVQLRGVDRAGSEYMCVQNGHIFDGPTDAASIAAIKSWHANAVRLPLNESCWLGLTGVPAAASGTAYQHAIEDFVHRLVQTGLWVILDLHWNAPGNDVARQQQAMPDQDHAPAFWTSVAAAFKDTRAVLFDIYNEPFPDSNRDTSTAWQCWRDGGICPGVPFVAAGMQELVTAVRSTGAGNVILLGGVRYASALGSWRHYEPVDPAHNLAASLHSYNFGGCPTQHCRDTTVTPLAGQVPIVMTEAGENDCSGTFINPLLTWADSHAVSYLLWSWDAWSNGCAAGPTLITDYAGTPTPYGAAYRAHLLRRAG